MTTLARDTVSFSHLINTVEQFTKYSGLKMNHEKTEVIPPTPLRNMVLEPTEVGMTEISGIVKILGVHFTYNHRRFHEKKLWVYREIFKRIAAKLVLERTYVDWKDSSD